MSMITIMNTQKKRILLLGANGLLGSDLLDHIQVQYPDKILVSYPHRSELDVLNDAALEAWIKMGWDLVINCIGYTKVDLCETQERDAFELNAFFIERLAKHCERHALLLIHFSTDYVFNGSKLGMYTEEDPFEPISVYGASKAAGDRALITHCSKYFLFRVQWLYGKNGPGFPKSIARLAKEKSELCIVHDQFGSPTSTIDISKSVLSVVEIVLFQEKKIAYGTYHLRAEGICSWYEFSEHIIKVLKLDCKLIPIPSSAYPTPAKRPMNGRLSIEKYKALGLYIPRHWQIASTHFLTTRDLNDA